MREKEKTLPERERVEDILVALTIVEQMMRSRLPMDLILNTMWIRGIDPEDPARWIREHLANKLKDARDLIESAI